MNDKLVNPIIELTKNFNTQADVKEFLTSIALLQDEMFRTNSSEGSTAFDGIRADHVGVIRQYLDFKGVDYYNFDAISSILNELAENLKDIEGIIVTLAFMPTSKYIKKLSKWFRNNVIDTALLDIKVESSILGGVQTIYNGHFIDQSLVKLIDNYFSDNEDEIFSKLQERIQ